MSQLIKILQILDLFNENRTTLAAEDVSPLLGVSRTTAFRYVKQLTDAGLLAKLSGRYSLGARIIQLDYKIRRFDPLLLCSQAMMRSLADGTGCTCHLSSMYGEEIINVHKVAGTDSATVSFGRGRPLPLFRGGASKVILANLPSARLKRLYNKYDKHPDVRELGADWPAFSRFFRDCKRNGHYISHGEVDVGITGIAAPIFNDERHVIGSLALVFDSRRESLFNESVMAGMLMSAAKEVTSKLAAAPSYTPGTAARQQVERTGSSSAR